MAASLQALDGALHPFDRRGEPRSALQLAERAEVEARILQRQDLMVSALIQQTRAAAAGGDFQRALEARERALAVGVKDSDDLAWLEVGERFWILGLYTVGLGAIDFSADFQLDNPGWLPTLEVSRRNYSDSFQRQLLILSGLLQFGLSLPSFEMARLDEDTTRSLTPLSQGIVDTTFCLASRDYYCALAPVLRARTLTAVGKVEEAIASLNAAFNDLDRNFVGLDEKERARLRGLIMMALGDAHAAPNSDPFALNLWLFGSALTAEERNIHAEPQEFQPVSPVRLRQAKDIYGRARLAFAGADCRRCDVDLLSRRAYLEYAAGRFQSAEESFRHAAENYDRLGDVFYAQSAANAAEAVGFLRVESSGRKSSAKDSGPQVKAKNTYGSWRSHITAARLLTRIAVLRGSRLEVPQALEAFERAEAYAAAVGASSLQGEIAHKKAILLRSVGRHVEAALVLDRDVRKGILESRRAAESLSHLYARVGSGGPRPDPTELALLKECELLTEMTAIALKEGQTFRFSELVLEWRELAQGGRVDSPVISCFRASPYEGYIRLAQGRYREAFEIAQKSQAPQLLSIVHLAQWVRHGKEGDRQRAIGAVREHASSLHEQLRQASRNGESSVSRLVLQAALQSLEFCVELLIQLERGHEASRLWDESERIWQESGRAGSALFQDGIEKWRVSSNRGAIQEELGWRAWETGDVARARVFFSQAQRLQARAIEQIQAIGAGLGTLADRSSYQEDAILAFSEHALLLARLGMKTENRDLLIEGLGVFEDSRAEIFHSMLEEVVGESGHDTPLREWWRIRSEVEARRVELANRVGLRLEAPADGDSTQDISRSELEKLENSLRDLERRLSGSSKGPSPGDRRKQFPDMIRQMQNRLKAEETPMALLIYFAHHRATGVWVINERDVHFRELETDSRGLRRSTIELANKMDGREAGWRGPAEELHRRLIAPIEALLPNAEAGRRPRLGIIPHQSLAKIPFVALCDDGPDGRFLIDDYDIFYLPSLRFLRRASTAGSVEASERARSALPAVFGYDTAGLSAAEQEAHEVAAALDVPSAVYVGPRATAERVRSLLGRAPILHIAAHTRADEQNPFQVAIELHGGPLHLYELAGRSVTARLVTLTGCETGLGDYSRSDEVIGLSRMFLAAGARQVVASLWRVEDETVLELMRSFYQALHGGASPLDALMQAQREARNQGVHPGFWAAFSSIGGDG